MGVAGPEMSGAQPQRGSADGIPARPAPRGARSGDEMARLLEGACRLLRELGPDEEHGRGQLEELRVRLAEGRFHLAVLGQFKRGKSTLLNALLGEEVLPTGVVPLTAIPTFIRSGDPLRARVHYADGREPDEVHAGGDGAFTYALSRYVTEPGNPGNHLGVAFVEIVHPASLLGQGVVLIDTPGIGSTWRHNTETTLNFLPRCDAAVFLVSADPPVTEVELDFLEQVRSRVSRLFFVMNKVDYLEPEEREGAVEFLRQVLREQAGLGPDIPLFCVSARRGLRARLKHDPAGWAESGLDEVERYLVAFLAREKSLALREAVSRKAADILEEELMRLRLAIRTLQLPLDDLRARLATFEEKIGEIERGRTVAKDLLHGEKRRMHATLEDQAEALRGKARAHLRGTVRATLDRAEPGARVDEVAVRDALADAVPGFFERELGETTALFRKRVSEALRPHRERADDLIGAIRRAAAELFEIPYHAPEGAQGYELIREPYWVTRSWSLALNPIPQGLLAWLLPARSVRAGLEKKLLEQVEMLVIRNVENLRWETFQSLNRTFDRFAAELDQRMATTLAATQGAVAAAAALRDQRSGSIASEVSRFESGLRELGRVRDRIVSGKQATDARRLGESQENDR